MAALKSMPTFPTIIQCDEGAEFKGILQNVAEHLKIKIRRGRPYTPRTQGKVERANQVLLKFTYSCSHTQTNI